MFTIMSSTSTFLANLSDVEKRVSDSSRQVSSGLRVQTVSDDPSVVTDILQLNSQISSNDRIKQDLSSVQTEVNAAEGAINSATTLMDRARQIAAEAATTTTSADARTNLSGEVLDLINEMAGLANTQVGGRYVFSGDSDQTRPYGSADPNANPTNSVGTYQGSAGNREIFSPQGGTFGVANTASQIFDSGNSTTSVFKSLTDLYTALKNNNASAAGTASENIGSAAVYLNGQQALYGDIQNRVSSALDFQSSLNTDLSAQVGALQDADQAQAITNMQLNSTAQSAAMAAYNAIPKKSLFDFLG